MTAAISTHVLDTARGRPAAGVAIALAQETAAGFVALGRGTTDADGRCRELLGGAPLALATYRLTFDTGAYFAAQGTTGFFPSVQIVFRVLDATQHHHVPLLLSPFGYSTYRGS